MVSNAVRKPAPLRDILEKRINGWTLQKIADFYGVSNPAICKRIQGAFKVLDGETLDSYRRNRVSILEGIELAVLSELSNTDKLQKASTNNLAYALTAVHNARRLEAGESTANLSLSAIVSHARDIRMKNHDDTLASQANR